ncbi:MAG: TIR domain-containing protein [Blastocatellia bacterium]
MNSRTERIARTMPTHSSHASEQPLEVFFSYSHRDEALRDELSKHLSILRRQQVIGEWHDRQIAPGGDWAGAIDKHLKRARIILLLISADFLASDYCYDIEMNCAMDRHEKLEAVVVPIILRPCSWSGSRFEKLQALPKNATPVTKWADRDDAFTDIAEGIRRLVRQVRVARSGGGPMLGEEVFRLCDRDTQEDEFDELIRRDAPVRVCGIRASEVELPDSLATRLTNITLRRSVGGVVASKLIAWPDAAGLAAGRLSLLARLYRELDCEDREPSAEAFVRAVSSRLEAAIVLRHNLRAERWGEGERDLLRWYLDFWDEVNARRPAPRFVIFFNLIDPERAGVWRSLVSRLGRGGFDRDAFERELRAMFDSEAACPKRLLTELPGVESHHVQDWFDRHGIFDPSDRLRHCRRLFSERSRRPMLEIEPALKQFHHEFLQQQGQ